MATGGWIDYDAVYGTDTGGKLPLDGLTIVSANRKHGTGYQGTPPQRLIESVRFLAVDPADFTFVDLGSGKGATLMTASSLGFASVVGVEFAKEFVDIAQDNLAKVGARNVTVLHEDAADFEFPPGNLIVYLYNPFSLSVLESVVNRLSKPRSGKLYVIFTRCHYKEFLDRTGFLVHIGCPANVSQVDIWQGKPNGDQAPEARKSIPRNEAKPLELAACMQALGLGSMVRTLCIGGEGGLAYAIIRALTGISRHLIVLEWRSQASIDLLLGTLGNSLTLLAEPWPQDRLIRNLDLAVNNLGIPSDIQSAERDWRIIAPALRPGGIFMRPLAKSPPAAYESQKWPEGYGTVRIVEIAGGDLAAGGMGQWLIVRKADPAAPAATFG